MRFAHGTFFGLVGFGVAACIQQWGTEAGFVAGCLAVPALVALLGAGLEVSLFRRVYNSSMWGQLLVSFGLVLVLNNVTRLVFGTQPLSMSPPRQLAGFIELGS